MAAASLKPQLLKLWSDPRAIAAACLWVARNSQVWLLHSRACCAAKAPHITSWRSHIPQPCCFVHSDDTLFRHISYTVDSRKHKARSLPPPLLMLGVSCTIARHRHGLSHCPGGDAQKERAMMQKYELPAPGAAHRLQSLATHQMRPNKSLAQRKTISRAGGGAIGHGADCAVGDASLAHHEFAQSHWPTAHNAARTTCTHPRHCGGQSASSLQRRPGYTRPAPRLLPAPSVACEPPPASTSRRASGLSRILTTNELLEEVATSCSANSLAASRRRVRRTCHTMARRANNAASAPPVMMPIQALRDRPTAPSEGSASRKACGVAVAWVPLELSARAL